MTDTPRSDRLSEGNNPLHIPHNLHDLTSLILESDLTIANTASEPRDVLMMERTALSWIKFSITLSAIAITIITNFRLDTSGDIGDKNPPDWFPGFSFGVSILFLVLGIATLLIGAFSYTQSIYNYKSHRVNIYSLEMTLGFLLVVGVILLVVNTVFMIAVGVKVWREWT